MGLRQRPARHRLRRAARRQPYCQPGAWHHILRGYPVLLQIKGQQDSRLLVNSAYDQHTWLYAPKLKMLPATPGDGEVGASAPQTIAPTLYRWDRWDTPIYHERQKSSYAIL